MKKTISMLLTLSLLLGLLGMISLTASAEEEVTYITDVAVTGVVDAVVGQTPTTEGITTTAEGVTLQPSWSVYDWENQSYSTFSGPFEAGKVYMLRVVIEAQEGYEFDYDTMNYTVNGSEPDAKTLYWSTYVDVEMYYIMDGVTVIDALEIVSVPQLQLGGTISDASLEAGIVLPEGVGYTVDATSTRWLEYSTGSGEPVYEEMTVTKGNYTMEVALSPKAGYWIDFQNAAVTTPAGMALEVSDRHSGTVEVSADFDLRDLVNSVEVTVAEVSVGDAITTDGISVTGGQITDQTCWFDENWEAASGSFQDGMNYILDLYIDAAEETSYSSETTVVNVNGAPHAGYVYVDSNYINIEYEVKFGKEVTTNGELTGSPEQIAAGEAEVPELEVAYGDMEIAGVQWVDEAGQAVTAFEDGKGYYLEVTLTPADGYKFEDYLDIWTEHGSADAVDISEDGTQAVASFYYSLKPQIEAVELTVTGVEVGKSVTDVKVTVPEGAKYTCEKIEVYDYNTGELLETGIFQDKARYDLEYTLKPAQGCDFADDLEVIVNGEESYNYYNGPSSITIFDLYSSKTRLDKVELTVTEPKVGGSITDAVPKAPEGANYTVDYSWYDTATGEYLEDGTFQDKHKYELNYYVTAADGYAFSDDTIATLNGVEAKNWYTEDGSENGNGYHTWSFLTAIEKVDFPAFPDAKVGDSTQLELVTPEGAGYTLMGSWTDTAGNTPETLADNNVYALAYIAIADEGFEFTEDTVVTVDGKEYKGMVQTNDSRVMALKTYIFGMKMIDKIELTVTEPANGEKPGKVTVSNKDANYTLDMTDWSTNTSGDIEDDPDAFKTFQYGNYYYLGTYITADDGYAFAEDVKIYINGEEVEPVVGYNMGIMYSLCHSFGKLEEAKQDADNSGTPTPPTTPPTGDETPVLLAFVAMICAALGMAVTVGSKRKYGV